MFDFSDAPSIFPALAVAMILVSLLKRRVLVRAGMGITHPNVEKGLLIRRPEPIYADIGACAVVEALLYFFFRKGFRMGGTG